MKKRFLALLLALCTLIPLAVSCGGGEGSETTTATSGEAAGTTTTVAGETTAPEETTVSTELKTNLPEDLRFDGKTINVISRGRDWCKDEVSVEALNGDVINDAIYERNAAVEDRLGLTINNQLTSGNDQYEITEIVRTQVMAGTEEYNLFANSTYSTIMYTGDNLFQDLSNLKYLDLSQSYWSQGFNDAATIGDAQYFVSGPIALSMYRFIFATFFNKNMFDEMKIPYLYEVVDSGKWTLEYQRQISSTIYEDLNGDGQRDDSDKYGFVSNHDMIGVDPYWSSCALPILKKTEDNYLAFAADIDRLSRAVDAINLLFWENDGAFPYEHLSSDSEQESIAAMFAQDQAAMVTLRLIQVEGADMRDMGSLYGIVPMPKLDEAQEEYYSYAHDQITSYGVPLTVTGDELEMVGAFLEVMACESVKTVTPAYYELALKTKYVSDEESVVMLDKIVDSFYIDPGILYTKKVDSFHQKLRTWVGNNRNTVSSQIKASQRVIDKNLGILNESMAKLQ